MGMDDVINKLDILSEDSQYDWPAPAAAKTPRAPAPRP
jgi:hypothetical protein